jgi:hypothetical protein
MEWTNKEQLWEDNGKGNMKFPETNVSHCHFVCQKSHMSWPVIKNGPPRWEAGDKPPEPTPDTCVNLWCWH